MARIRLSRIRMFWAEAVLLALLVFANNSIALDITKNEVWSAGTHVITNNLFIQNNATLTIQPGAIVKFTANGLLSVSDGALDASGVTFTWNDIGSEWKGIHFQYGDSLSRLENCVVEHANGNVTTTTTMIYFYGAGSDPGPTITGCTIGNGTASRGITVSNASPQLSNNNISGFSDCGVYLNTSYSSVIGNEFTNNTAGVHIYYNGTTAPVVMNNNYSGSTESDVRVSGTIYKNVSWNEGAGTTYRVMMGTGAFGITGTGRLTISDGIIVKVDPGGLIMVDNKGALVATGTTFTWADNVNEWQGIDFGSPDMSASRLENCVIEHAKGLSVTNAAIEVAWGAPAAGAPKIIACTIGNSTAPRGIVVLNASPVILKNSLTGFSDYGIHVTGASSKPVVAGNLITGNTRGVGVFNGSTGVYRVNRIQGNTEYGIYNAPSVFTQIVDARYNWWGNSNGPLAPDNPSGAGDRITSQVDYAPWAGNILDSEPDGMWDWWEVDQFGNIGTADATSDFDNDGLLDKDEFLYGTDPNNTDSDGDGVFDGLEVQVGMNPSLAGDYNLDSDGDTYSNLREQISNTDPYDAASVPPVLADGNVDGDVDGKELSAFIAEFGSLNCPGCQYDLDTDGDVDIADLFLFSEDFGRTTP